MTQRTEKKEVRKAQEEWEAGFKDLLQVTK